MSLMNLSPAAAMTLVKSALLSGVLMTLTPAIVLGQQMEKKGTTPYVTHFIFRPLMSIDIPGLGTATNLEAVGTTQNMKGEKMLDKMSAHCAALSVASGDKKYIAGACVLADSDGDKIFSTFDTRDTDESQPQMSCGTHIITGGTGKYKESPGVSHLLVSQCLRWLAPAAIPPWTSHITRRGRLNDRETSGTFVGALCPKFAVLCALVGRVSCDPLNLAPLRRGFLL